MNDDYKKRLIDTCNLLIVQRRELFTSMLNLACEGPLKEINDAFQVGEAFTFSTDDFKNTGDSNLELLLEEHESINLLVSSLININAIKEEELDSE